MEILQVGSDPSSHSSAAREEFYSLAEQHQRNHSAIWSNYGFCVYFPCINDFQDCCQGQETHCTVVVPILIISLCFCHNWHSSQTSALWLGQLSRDLGFHQRSASLTSSLADQSLQSWPDQNSRGLKDRDTSTKLSFLQSGTFPGLIPWQRAVWQAVLLHAHASWQEMPCLGSMQGCICVHKHTIHTAPAWLFSCWKQLWMADKEGVSIGMFLIKSADSNQPTNLGLISFQYVAFTKLLKNWAKRRNTLFWFFQRKPS